MALHSGSGPLLVVDNYDSFTYNLVHMLEGLSGEEILVIRNEDPWEKVLEESRAVILSPGPGVPSEAGSLPAIVRAILASGKKTLGVCLGLQALVEATGGRLVNLQEVFHGVSSPVRIISPDQLFMGINEETTAGRYHSWVAERKSLPECFTVTAEDLNGQIMAIAHKTLPVKGVQFHPESVLTPEGSRILSNWLSLPPC